VNRKRFKRQMRKHKPHPKPITIILHEMFIQDIKDMLYNESILMSRIGGLSPSR
jgi:hypothetical protein